METVRPVILTVEQLNNYIKSVIDNDYKVKNIFICGEVSNFTNHLRTGHFYMTIKDEKAQIKAVMFRSYAERLKFMPENGMKIIAFGSVSVFPRDGQYQFYIENMQPDGLGSLNLAYEQLKEKLSNEGLFDDAHKKSLPLYPKTIGVVTSPTGAAFQDIKNVLARRWPIAKIILCGTQVQGESAPLQIVSAIRKLDESNLADVIILARGGGSIEDLWSFNDEKVARTIYDCNTPIISGVGHETDFTIADFVADLRAPTPSAAAEVSVPDMFSELDKTNSQKVALGRLLINKIGIERTRIEKLMTHNVMKGPEVLLNEKRLVLDTSIERMNAQIIKRTQDERNRLALAAGKLSAYSPLLSLSRGYSIAKSKDGHVIKNVSDINPPTEFTLKLADGTVLCRSEKIMEES